MPQHAGNDHVTHRRILQAKKREDGERRRSHAEHNSGVVTANIRNQRAVGGDQGKPAQHMVIAHDGKDGGIARRVVADLHAALEADIHRERELQRQKTEQQRFDEPQSRHRRRPETGQRIHRGKQHDKQGQGDERRMLTTERGYRLEPG
jgi:hypothetical protein